MPGLVGVETIALKRQIKGEFGPRYYTMTGSDFDTMLDAVKRLEFRQPEKTLGGFFWLVRGGGIEALRAQGFTVVEDLYFRTKFIEQAIGHGAGFTIPQKSISVTAYVEQRDERGGWIDAWHITLWTFVSEEYIAFRRAEIDRQAKEAFPEIKFPPANRYQAVRALARELVEWYGNQINEMFTRAMNGARSPEAFAQGKSAMKALLADENSVDTLTFAATIVDGQCVIYENSHPVTKKLIAQDMAEREEQMTTTRAAAAEKTAYRESHAEEITARFLSSDTKAQIAQLAAEAGHPFEEGIEKKLKKEEMIDRLKHNPAFCSWYIHKFPYFG
jgi:hypothetical protein